MQVKKEEIGLQLCWLLVRKQTVGVFNEAIACVGEKFGITGKSYWYHTAE